LTPFANVASIAYWDSGGADTIESAGAISVTLNLSGDDTLTIDSGSPTINFVDAGSTPSFPPPVAPSISQSPLTTPSIKTATPSRKAYRPPSRTARFSTTRI